MSFTEFFLQERQSTIFNMDILKAAQADPNLYDMVLGEPSINRLRELARLSVAEVARRIESTVDEPRLTPEKLAEIQRISIRIVEGDRPTAIRLEKVKAEGFTTLTTPLNPQFKKAGLKKKKKKESNNI